MKAKASAASWLSPLVDLCFAKTSYTRKMSDLAEVSIPTFR
jgi:hypothetical protein